jgi:hypothetical protein
MGATLNKNDELVKKIVRLAMENKFNFYLPEFFEDCETHYFRDRQVDEVGNSIWIQIDFSGFIHFHLIVNDDHDNIFDKNVMYLKTNEEMLMEQLFAFLLDIHSNKN